MNNESRGVPRWRAHRIRDVLLAVLAVAAGSIDALSWLALGKVFSAFMTGNMVFIAVGLSSRDSVLALHAAVAVGAFGAGAWATAAAMPPQHPGVLWPARVTSGLLGSALVQLAFWGVWLAVGGHPGSMLLVMLALSAFAMGTQTSAAIALGGTITGEHGVGLAKKPFLKQQLGEASFSLLKMIKGVLDPQGLLNPGKIFD